MNTPNTGNDEIFAVLRELRDATERAVLALERDDPDSALTALDEGARASGRLDALYNRIPAFDPKSDPRLRAEADAIRVLQAIGIDRSEQGKSSVSDELQALTLRDRDWKQYRPSEAGADRVLDLQG